jgi:hypothetical protein|tara:strand:+ start:761 stop:1177 length:417 start_codon:yes stop_codon:yes gene_type:complete
MRKSIELAGVGEVALAPPRSLVSVSDLIAEYSGADRRRAHLARLSAAAIGLCWARSNKLNAPIYNLSGGDLIEYGGQVLEFLLKNKVTVSSVYSNASDLINELYELLPKETEVSEAANYFRGEGEDGSSDTGDREAVV